MLLQIQSVYYSMKNNDMLSDDNDDFVYYPQILLEQCRYRLFSNYKIIHKDLVFTDNKPDTESEEEEINENTVLDE